MEKIRLHELGTSTIDFDPSVPCLIHSMSQFVMSTEFRVQMNIGLNLLIDKKNELGKISW
ncbi:hypothetical protein LVD17_15050 [Fulvivirga ulvae]|uniref:hypothetical protein n=1 Tax=Fulvivirga ulvae TaxID=2904245 RepID=UPI001F161AF0|nr:hypothetical protein [Fulvivirga ulvae]UII29616.1 hypothetical protein LVD17_15050 [Fulvivirga ulvae]